MVKKMFDSNRRSGDCGSGPKLLDYLYDEMREEEKASFELHLEECQNCAEELGAFSSLRMSIGELRPQETLASADCEPGFLHVIREWIANGFGVKVLAGAAAVMLIAALGLYVVFTYSSEMDSPSVVREDNSQPEEITPAGEIANSTSKPEPIAGDEREQVSGPERATPAGAKSVDVRRKTSPSRRNSATRPSSQMAEASEPPRLSEAASEEIEDDSLRLTDLFTDVSED